MQRRDLLVAVGGATVLGGCSQFSSDSSGDAPDEEREEPTATPNEPADLRLESLSAEETEVEIGQEVTVSARVSNHGDQESSAELFLELATEEDAIQNLWEESALIDLDGGETTTVAKSVPIEYVGDYVLRTANSYDIRNMDETVDIAALPARLNVAERFETADGFEIIPSSGTTRQEYPYENPYSDGALASEADDGYTYLFVYVSVRNDSSASEPPSARDFTVRADGQSYGLEVSPYGGRELAGGVNIYDGSSIPPGSTERGLLLFEVPENEEYELVWTPLSGQQTVYWQTGTE